MFKKFQYYLTEEDGRCLKIENGVVTATSIRTPLPNTPDGWQDIIIAWERDLNRHGLIRNFTLPLGFVLEGGKIVRDAFYKNNIERKIFLVIQRLGLNIDSLTYEWVYNYFYKGELDLTSFVREADKVTCNVMEGGISKLLKANEGTTYEIPFDDDHIRIKTDGIKIDNVAKFAVVDDIEDRSTGFAGDWQNLSTIPVTFISKEGINSQIAVFSQDIDQFAGNTLNYMDDSNNYLLNNTGKNTVAVRVKGSFKIECLSEAGSVEFSADFKTSDDTQYVILNQYSLVEGQSIVQDFDFTIPVQGGQKLFLFASFKNDGAGVQLARIKYRETSFEMSYVTRNPTTYTKAHLPLNLFKKIGAKISGYSSDWESNLLAEFSNLSVTSMDAIRGIPGSVIKTKMNDFYDAFNAILCACMPIEFGKVRIEKRDWNYNTSNPVSLGDVKKFKDTPANDITFNTIKIGYPEKDTEDVNGKYSFNNTHLYTTPISRIVKEYTAICPYITDPYVIELERSKTLDKATTDNKNDNSVAILNCVEDVNTASLPLIFVNSGNKLYYSGSDLTLLVDQRLKISGTSANDNTYRILSTGFDTDTYFVLDKVLTDETVTATVEIITGKLYILRRETYDNLGDPDDFGLPYPDTVFNIEDLTPKRMLARHAAWIRSIMRGFDDKKLVYQTTEKNSLLKTVKAGITIIEKADVDISNLSNAIVQPVYFEFETEVPTDLVELMEANPNRCFSFEWEGTTYKGFNIRTSLAPNTEQPQTFKLLATPDTDLKTLI